MQAFRLYARIRFSRPVDRDKDFISVNDFDMVIGGKHITLGFMEMEGTIIKQDPNSVEFMLKDPDWDAYPDMKGITEEMTEKVTAVLRVGMEDSEYEDPISITAIEKMAFVLPHKGFKAVPIPPSAFKETTFE